MTEAEADALQSCADGLIHQGELVKETHNQFQKDNAAKDKQVGDIERQIAEMESQMAGLRTNMEDKLGENALMIDELVTLQAQNADAAQPSGKKVTKKTAVAKSMSALQGSPYAAAATTPTTKSKKSRSRSRSGSRKKTSTSPKRKVSNTRNS